jgi:hypothetical protein
MISWYQVAAFTEPDVPSPPVPRKSSSRKRNEHPGAPDQPKPRRTSAQVVADRDATQKQSIKRAALIAEKRRQLAELEAEEVHDDQLEELAFVRTVGDMPSGAERMEVDEDEPAGDAIEIDLPETRTDAMDDDDASEHEPPAKKKPSRAKKAKAPKEVNPDTVQKGKQKGAVKKSKVSVFCSTSTCSDYQRQDAKGHGGVRAEVEKMRTEIIRENTASSAQK